MSSGFFFEHAPDDGLSHQILAAGQVREGSGGRPEPSTTRASIAAFRHDRAALRPSAQAASKTVLSEWVPGRQALLIPPVSERGVGRRLAARAQDVLNLRKSR